MTTGTIPRCTVDCQPRTGLHSRGTLKINRRIVTGLRLHKLRPARQRKVVFRSRRTTQYHRRTAIGLIIRKCKPGVMTTSTSLHRVVNKLKSRRRIISPHRPRPRRWKDRSRKTIRVRMFPRRLHIRHGRRSHHSHRNRQTGPIPRVKTKTGGEH